MSILHIPQCHDWPLLTLNSKVIVMAIFNFTARLPIFYASRAHCIPAVSTGQGRQGVTATVQAATKRQENLEMILSDRKLLLGLLQEGVGRRG